MAEKRHLVQGYNFIADNMGLDYLHSLPRGLHTHMMQAAVITQNE